MVPDFDLQLQVAIKALQDAVAPAVDEGNSVAKEQLQLAIGTLSIVRSRLPLERRYVRRLAEDAIGMGEKLSELLRKQSAQTQSLKSALEEMRVALGDPEADTWEIEAARKGLNTVISETIEAVSLTPELQAMVVRESELPINRERAWYVDSGFEQDKKSLKPIEELL